MSEASVPAGLRARWLQRSGNSRGALWMIASGLGFSVMAVGIKLLGHLCTGRTVRQIGGQTVRDAVLSPASRSMAALACWRCWSLMCGPMVRRAA